MINHDVGGALVDKNLFGGSRGRELIGPYDVPYTMFVFSIIETYFCVLEAATMPEYNTYPEEAKYTDLARSLINLVSRSFEGDPSQERKRTLSKLRSYRKQIK